MKNLGILLLSFVFSSMHGQLINKQFNQNTEFGSNQKQSITLLGNNLDIKVKTVYNALPDGYHVTYTFTTIDKNLDKIEFSMIEKTKRLEKLIKKINLKKSDFVVDAIGLDPIFDLSPDTNTIQTPSGYKSTHNITFRIPEIGLVDQLTKICYEEKIYDLIDITPFITETKFIKDSLKAKSLEILNDKKDFVAQLGFKITDGKTNFQKNTNVIYPSERYLKSYINNNSIYKHHISTNSTINYNRKVEIDAYYNLDLRDVDYVFNSKEVKPVVQFIYEITYGFVKRDREAEAEAKALRKEQQKQKKEIYIMDKNGKIRAVNF